MFKSEEVMIREEFVKRGYMSAEIREFLSKLLEEDGFSDMSISLHERPYRISIKLDNTKRILSNNRVLLKQTRALIAKRLGQPEENIEIVVEVVRNRKLCPAIQAQSIKQKFLDNMTYRRAVASSIKQIMSGGAQGCVIEVSGKFKGQRARSVKTIEGTVIYSGHPKEEFMRYATSSVLLKQGVIGIKVGIMLPCDPEGINGPSKPMVDKIKVLQIKDE